MQGKEEHALFLRNIIALVETWGRQEGLEQASLSQAPTVNDPG